MPITFEFATREYRLSHDHEPRGYGSWAFTHSEQAAPREPIWAPPMKYSAAKAWVRNYIRARAPQGWNGFITVQVLT